MENLKMSEVWKFKLRELRLQEALLRLDETKKDELHDLQEMIAQVKKELAKEFLIEKEEEEKEKVGMKI